jgi:small subunit ribosomal protein S15
LALTKEHKAEVLNSHKAHETDTGSSEVQVALLTERIRKLTDHFGAHSRDNNSKRGLLKMVGRRRRLLRYLERTDIGRYRALVVKLGIRG